jgi:hypothetical protein
VRRRGLQQPRGQPPWRRQGRCEGRGDEEEQGEEEEAPAAPGAEEALLGRGRGGAEPALDRRDGLCCSGFLVVLSFSFFFSVVIKADSY